MAKRRGRGEGSLYRR
jgi:integrase